jgi:hypothetical protein
MQHRINDLAGFAIKETDGHLGKVLEFYFDDAAWTIRYMVVETGSWLSGRKVLISPVALGKPDMSSRSIPVNLTREQVRLSPDIDTDKPVYRQHEIDLHEHYGWPNYWEPGFAGMSLNTFNSGKPVSREKPDIQHHDNPHLRSTKHITGYRIHATDGEIGFVRDFIVEDENWKIMQIVVETGEWSHDREFLIAPQWINRVDWGESSVFINRPRKNAND